MLHNNTKGMYGRSDRAINKTVLWGVQVRTGAHYLLINTPIQRYIQFVIEEIDKGDAVHRRLVRQGYRHYPKHSEIYCTNDGETEEQWIRDRFPTYKLAIFSLDWITPRW